MEVDAGSCSPALDATDNADAESDGPTREELGDDYWDPPCKVCKKVDDEANVLCELCNGAYHLACIANIKPPLPRSPDDSEWFCRRASSAACPRPSWTVLASARSSLPAPSGWASRRRRCLG